MKRLFKPIMAAILFFTLIHPIKAQQDRTADEAKGINFFEGTWNEALAYAKKENKLIFLDAYASWCGPCKEMKRKVFPVTEAGDFFNEKFINVEMDMEKGDGPALATRYGVRAYPSLFFIDQTGEVKKYAVGYHNARQLIKFGETALEN